MSENALQAAQPQSRPEHHEPREPRRVGQAVHAPDSPGVPDQSAGPAIASSRVGEHRKVNPSSGGS
jgi:hypothetical protein